MTNIEEYIEKAHKDPKFMKRMVDRIRKDESKKEQRKLVYNNLTESQLNDILENDCKFCGSQRCLGIYDEHSNTCSAIDKFIN